MHFRTLTLIFLSSDSMCTGFMFCGGIWGNVRHSLTWVDVLSSLKRRRVKLGRSVNITRENSTEMQSTVWLNVKWELSSCDPPTANLWVCASWYRHFLVMPWNKKSDYFISLNLYVYVCERVLKNFLRLLLLRLFPKAIKKLATLCCLFLNLVVLKTQN